MGPFLGMVLKEVGKEALKYALRNGWKLVIPVVLNKLAEPRTASAAFRKTQDLIKEGKIGESVKMFDKGVDMLNKIKR